METKLILVNMEIDDGVYICWDCANKNQEEGLVTVVETREANPMCYDCGASVWDEEED